jgi:DNA repair photolyase
MNNYPWQTKTGITRTPEFERKRLAGFAVNVGLKCGHDCMYCSSSSILRRHPAFRALGLNPFEHGYSIVDPTTPERIARDAARIRERGLIQLCTLSDAWSPEAQQHKLGRACLQAILSQPDWSVRILTKNAAIRSDFDLIATHRDRVLVGLSITATPEKSHVISITEANASSIEERMNALATASLAGLRTYAMFCPLLPGIADSPERIDQLVKFATACRVEEVFVEPVNGRGPGLKLCQEALAKAGYETEAQAVGAIRKQDAWSAYVVALIRNVQASVRRHSEISKLRILIYPDRLLPEHLEAIRQDDAGVVWLGNDSNASTTIRVE